MGKLNHALISVSDKTGVVEFARGLVELGATILSTGRRAGHGSFFAYRVSGDSGRQGQNPASQDSRGFVGPAGASR